MRADLTAAMKRRERPTVEVLRAALAALANAEAVEAIVPAPREETAGRGDVSPIAGAAVGLGATEVARRELSADDVARVLSSERAELLVAAAQASAAGQSERAEKLRGQAEVLATYLTT